MIKLPITISADELNIMTSYERLDEEELDNYPLIKQGYNIYRNLGSGSFDMDKSSEYDFEVFLQDSDCNKIAVGICQDYYNYSVQEFEHPITFCKIVEEVTITLKEYNQLLEYKTKLEYLEEFGVDNWPGYSEAMQAYWANNDDEE